MLCNWRVKDNIKNSIEKGRTSKVSRSQNLGVRRPTVNLSSVSDDRTNAVQPIFAFDVPHAWWLGGLTPLSNHLQLPPRKRYAFAALRDEVR
jgi:hypothetical protein